MKHSCGWSDFQSGWCCHENWTTVKEEARGRSVGWLTNSLVGKSEPTYQTIASFTTNANILQWWGFHKLCILGDLSHSSQQICSAFVSLGVSHLLTVILGFLHRWRSSYLTILISWTPVPHAPALWSASSICMVLLFFPHVRSWIRIGRRKRA